MIEHLLEISENQLERIKGNNDHPNSNLGK